MKHIQKEYKQLLKYYNNELKKCHKLNFKYWKNNLDYFYTYLKFMRDIYVLTEEELDPEKNLKLASICAAVAEIENYYNCISNYYDLSTNVPVQKDKTLSKAEVTKKYNLEKRQHWDTFWGLVSMNMETWFTEYEYSI